MFYTFNSLTVPPTIFRYDIAARKSAMFRAPKMPGLDAGPYETKQVFYTSKDGTRDADVPGPQEGPGARRQQPDADVRLRRLQHRAVAELQRARLALLEQGFVYASANMRGGGEYGESVAPGRA